MVLADKVTACSSRLGVHRLLQPVAYRDEKCVARPGHHLDINANPKE